jgi:hypothetical protein
MARHVPDRVALRLGAIAAIVTGLSRVNAALAAPADAGERAPVPNVEFGADRLELDPHLGTLVLSGHVVVAADRYRLRSDRLTLRRREDLVYVDGPGLVAFCECPNPPVSFGFQSAVVKLPGDLVLSQPTLRIGRVPVFWLPALWLRSPDKVGLLPLVVAWRGTDGPVLGSGAHLPVGSSSVLDLVGAGYLRGGADVEARLRTPDTASRARWDYFQGSAVTLDLRGALHPREGGAVVWSVDSLRGPRALSGPSLLETVAQRDDRARAVAGTASQGFVAGVGAFADGPRAGPVGSVVAGPSAHAGWGTPLSDVGSADVGVGVTSLQNASGSTSLVSEDAEARIDAHAGGVAIGVEARSRGLLAFGDVSEGHVVATGGAAELAVPLVKALGPADSSSWQHWVTPFIDGLAGIADVRAPSVISAPLPDGGFYALASGARTTVGEVAGARAAISLSGRFAVVGATAGSAIPLATWTAAGRGPWLATRGVGLVRLDGSNGQLTIAELRVGAEKGPFLGATATGESGNVPVLGRLTLGGWDAPWVPWLVAPDTWSLGGRVGVAWTRWVSSLADVDYDAGSGSLLGVRGTLGFRHPCRCFALDAWGGYRAGRKGPDVWLTVALAP